MSKVFGIDLDTWAALNAIGAIVGAFGTVAAVIVALRLARRDYLPRFTVTSAIMQTIDHDPSGQPLELLTITGTNLGHTTINVKGIFWTFGWFQKQIILRRPFSNDCSDPLPKEIAHSQQVFLAEPLSDFTSRLDAHVSYLKTRWFGRFLIRSLRSGLYTSNGDFSSRADARIRALLTKAYDAKPSEQKPTVA